MTLRALLVDLVACVRPAPPRSAGDKSSDLFIVSSPFGQPLSLEGEALGKSTQKEAGDIVTGLTTVGSKEFGAGLIAAAQKENREALQRATVGKVQEVLVALSKQRDYIHQCEKNIALLEAKVKAFQDGEFTVSTYGVITFNDKALQAGVVRMLECKNCGYGGRRDIDPV